MSVKITQPIPPNVVEIGNEITQAVVDGLMSASPSPSSSNPYATQSLLNDKLSLSGGTMTGQITIDGDGLLITNGNYVDYPDHFSSLGINYAGISCGGDQDGFSLSGGGLTFTGSEFTSFNSNGVIFPDNTIQTTAATSLSFATTSQVIIGTSTNTVVNPSTLIDNKYMAGGRAIGYLTWTAATSGTGASAGTLFIKAINAPTSAIGHAISYVAPQNGQRGQIYNSGIDFTKNVVFGGRFSRITSGTIDSNSIFRCNIGRAIPISSAGDLSSRGVGIRIVGNAGALELQVHNGTTLYNVSSTFTPVYNQTFDVVITVNSGTATLYVNGSSVATSSNAPTTLLTGNFSSTLVECQNTTTLTNSPYQMNCSDQFLHISPV